MEGYRFAPGEAIAIIPARSGSKGVPNKNIRAVRGYPLMAWSIAAAQMCGLRPLVSTDSEAYAEVARRYGGEAPFLRPAEISDDAATDLGFVLHALAWLQEHEGAVPELLVHLRPTYPLRERALVAGAVEAMRADPAAHCLRSAHRLDGSPYKWFKDDGQGRFVPLFDSMTLDECNNPRQGFPSTWVPDGYVDVLRCERVLETGVLHASPMIAWKVPDGVDVDSLADYAAMEANAEAGEPEVLRWLREHYEPVGEAL